MIYASPLKRGEKIEVIEDIIPLANVKASYRTERSITKVYLAPQMKELAFEKENGRVNIVIPEIDCHQMIVLEYK